MVAVGEKSKLWPMYIIMRCPWITTAHLALVWFERQAKVRHIAGTGIYCYEWCTCKSDFHKSKPFFSLKCHFNHFFLALLWRFWLVVYSPWHVIWNHRHTHRDRHFDFVLAECHRNHHRGGNDIEWMTVTRYQKCRPYHTNIHAKAQDNTMLKDK